MHEKVKSRKLWAWITWIVLTIVSIILTKTISPEIINWFGVVTTVYIGGQSAIDAVIKMRK